MINYTSLLTRCQFILHSHESDIYATLNKICAYLKSEVKHYDWVGFYMANHKEKNLYLKAFAGIPTDHTVIPFGKGICGQVAVSNQTFLVDDVSAQDNYIACDIHVKSEIVIPLFSEGKNIGQIDIDSNIINAFSNDDTLFLEELNSQIAHKLF